MFESEPKRRRILDELYLMDLPSEMLREIITYVTTGTVSLTCKKLREVALAVPSVVRIGQHTDKELGFAWLSLLPDDTYPYRLDIQINEKDLSNLEDHVRVLSKSAPVDSPRIKRAVVVNITTDLEDSEMIARVRDIVKGIVDLNNIQTLYVSGGTCGTVDLITPGACKLIKLVADPTPAILDNPILAVPVEIKLRWVSRRPIYLAVSQTSFNPRLRSLKAPSCWFLVNGTDLYYPEARTTFGIWYRSVYKIRQGGGGEILIYDRESTCHVSRALVRGDREPTGMPSAWERNELVADPKGVPVLKWMAYKYWMPSTVQLKPHSILRRRWDATDTIGKYDHVKVALGTRIPPSPAVTLTQWTAERIAAIFGRWDVPLTRDFLRKDFEDPLVGSRMARYILKDACANLCSVGCGTVDYKPLQRAVDLLRFLPQGVLTPKDDEILALAKCDSDRSAHDITRAKATLDTRVNEWRKSIDQYCASLSDCV